jgi:hypothetical protein
MKVIDYYQQHGTRIIKDTDQVVYLLYSYNISRFTSTKVQYGR